MQVARNTSGYRLLAPESPRPGSRQNVGRYQPQTESIKLSGKWAGTDRPVQWWQIAPTPPSSVHHEGGDVLPPPMNPQVSLVKDRFQR